MRKATKIKRQIAALIPILGRIPELNLIAIPSHREIHKVFGEFIGGSEKYVHWLLTSLIWDMASWSELPRDLLHQITEYLPLHKDVVRMGAVCKPWNSFLVDNLNMVPPSIPLSLCLPIQNPVPLLMQPLDKDKEGTIDFFSVSNKTNYGGIYLPDMNKKWISGSSDGWLFTVEMNGREIDLLNPVTKAQIRLPHLWSFQHPAGETSEDEDFGFIEKAVISCDPNRRRHGEDFVVMAIISNLAVLSFCRPGDKEWTNADDCLLYLSDVLPYKGEFFAITEKATTVASDPVHVRDGAVRVILEGSFEPRKRYLVESITGDLLHAARVMDDATGTSTIKFEVFKLETCIISKFRAIQHWYKRGTLVREQKIGYRWIKLETLGDQVLFLGQNRSVALPAELAPGGKGNLIYFTDDDIYRHATIVRTAMKNEQPGGIPAHYDMGVYDMENDSVQRFEEVMGKSFTVPPVWVSPNPR